MLNGGTLNYFAVPWGIINNPLPLFLVTVIEVVLLGAAEKYRCACQITLSCERLPLMPDSDCSRGQKMSYELDLICGCLRPVATEHMLLLCNTAI